jgi:signal transduction histidine kinase/HD-like signal output (HDOD) protein
MDESNDQLREKRVELILQQLQGMPELSHLAIAGITAPAGQASAIADAVTRIAGDVEFSRRVLGLLHACELGGPDELDSIDRVITRRGFELLRRAIMVVGIHEAFTRSNSAVDSGLRTELKQLSETSALSPHSSGPGTQSSSLRSPFNSAEFWKHSIAVGCCAQLLAEQMMATWGRDSELEPFECFACGVLHDIGKVVLDTVLPKSFSRAIEAVEMLRGNIADLERTVIGLDHMVAGKRLAEQWSLPGEVRDCIWLHGQNPEALPATVSRPRLVNLITLADMIVREQHLGYSGNYTFNLPRQHLLDAIGLSEEHVAQTIDHLIERVEASVTALGGGNSNPAGLLKDAVAQANRELGRVQRELEVKNQRLSIRAGFFEALAGFQGEMRPDAPPQVVLRAIGQTAVNVLHVTSACVFSLIPGQNFAEALLFDQHGEVFESTLIDCPQRPSTMQTGEGPVLSAGQELEWLLAIVSPRLAFEQRFWISLEADRACIGGIVWGAMTGESARLGSQVQELTALSAGWALALRTAQIREEARSLAEQLAETNRKLQSAQAEILRSRTMITVGEMAAGAAHEMNNPLAVISGRSQLLASQLSDPKQKAAAHLIHEQSHRLTDIITELMDFAKPVPPNVGECDLADLIERALHEAKMQADTVDRTVEVTIGDVPKVVVDPAQMMAALMELFDNAFNATDPVKGHIVVHAAFDPFSRKVAVTISDNGCGMDQNTLKRAFDPFFSSRPAGRRRGMGLAKALRWAEASGGSIRLESRIGQGTRSLVLLPASQPTANQAKKAPRRVAQ